MTLPLSADQIAQHARRSALINGDMRTAQRGTTFDSTTTPANNDDVYLLDRWVLLSDGNDVVDVTQETDAPDQFSNSWKFDVETASKKFGLVQIIESINCKHLIGETVTLSFYVKGDGNLGNVRAAVLSWNSTADTVTSDVVSAWAASGTNPTWAANWTAENTAEDIALTTGWVRHEIGGIDIDTSSTTNVAVVLWLDDTDAQVGEYFEVTGVQLEIGRGASDFEFVDYQQQLAQCYRYYYKHTWSGSTGDAYMGVSVYTTNAAYGPYYLPVDMRTDPAFAVSAPGDFVVLSGGVNYTPSALSTVFAHPRVCEVYAGISGATAGYSGWIRSKAASPGAYFEFDAEL